LRQQRQQAWREYFDNYHASESLKTIKNSKGKHENKKNAA